ncbi:hypothetical protein P43SY_007189 [Pythium insidiosum]|uniref:Uncharacterized protein n=1 Tax=Pythium insidiosum TaxID=114742 RepID=A0AAD5Q727_PYTIN|nr:hypothetical protein P43SY_007189 [Pythium insidiosum]
MSRGSRKRRRPAPSAATAAAVPWLLLLLPPPAAPELAWTHAPAERPTAMAVDADGNVVLGGCAAGGRAYVAKFSPEGRPVWRRESDATWSESAQGVDDDASEEEQQGATRCVVALDTDAELHVYAAGSLVARGDADAFVVRLAPASGDVLWRTELATPFADHARAVRVSAEHLYVAGHSEGSLPAGAASRSNCDGISSPPRSRCENGFVLQLARASGELLWSHELRSTGADRVFDVSVSVSASEPVVVVVGDTTGDLAHGDDRGRLPHAGDVFVAALDARSGRRLWVSQLEAAPGAVPAADLCAQPDGRGRCGVAVDASGGVFVSGSTSGWLATAPDADASRFRETCGAARARTLVGGTCLQLFVARLALASGEVAWVQQLLDAAHTTSDGVQVTASTSSASTSTSASGSPTAPEDVLVLGRADAGLLSSESMEQLVLLRVSAAGAIEWTRELGLAGEDRSVALAPSRAGSVLVAGVGSREQSRSATTPLTTYVLRVAAGSGRPLPMCVDRVAFAGSSPPLQPRDATHVLVEVQLRRAAPQCVGPLSVRYRLEGAAARLLTATGSVVFRDEQSSAALVVAVPRSALAQAESPEPLAVRIELEPTHVLAIDGPSGISVVLSAGEAAATPAPPSRAADGSLWRELSSVFSLAMALSLLVVVLVGRLCWTRCLRRAKVFQYKMIRLRRRRSSQSDSHAAVAKALGMVPVRSSPKAQDRGLEKPGRALVSEDDEAEELRSHLEEIQELNDSLEGLLNGHQSRRGSSASTPTGSPRRKSTVRGA